LSPVSLLDSRLIDTLEFYSGGFPVVYGDRMSAIIDATAVHPRIRTTSRSASTCFHSSAMAATEFADGRGHAMISGPAQQRRRSRQPRARTISASRSTPMALPRVDYEFDERHQRALETLISSDTIVARDNGEQNARAKYRNIYAWATLDHDWRNGASTRVIASYTDLENRRQGDVNEPGVRTADVHDERLFHVVGLRVENSLDAGMFEHHFGGEVRGCGATTTTPAKCTSCRAFRFRDRRDSMRRAPASRRRRASSRPRTGTSEHTSTTAGYCRVAPASTRRPTTAPTTANNGVRD
jgi:hypothetical protein